MREKNEKELASSSAAAAAARCLSPSQVKQTLGRLDEDGETRRHAMIALRHHVEAMDGASVPRFLAQVSETKEKGSSRAYAISLYEDVARVHGTLIVPHIPRVMSTITRTLCSSGSSPQLQQACAKVVSTVAKHGIDENSPAQAPDVLTELCNPLIDVLAGKLEPLATGAAVCLQTLIESERWKYASDSVVEDICLKATVALGERSTRTVAHMQLARSLATTHSAFLSRYGVALLRSGVEILKSSPASASWQQRASAARLLTAVLPTVDRATVAEELSSTIQALDESRHDRTSNVRWSVKEALKTARGVLSEENNRRSGEGEEPLSSSWMGAASSPEPSTSSPRRRSVGSVSSDDMMMSSPPRPNANKFSRAAAHHRDSHSPVSSTIPVSPSAPVETPRSRVSAAGPPPPHPPLSPAHPPAAPQSQTQRSPLQATRLRFQVGSVDAAATALVNSFQEFTSPKKENWPTNDHPHSVKVGTVAFDSDPSPSTTPTRGRSKRSSGEEMLTPPLYSSPPRANAAALQRSFDRESSPVFTTEGGEETSLFPMEPLVVRVGRDQEGVDLLTEDEEMFLLSNSGSPHRLSGQGIGQFELQTGNRGSSKGSPTSARSLHGVLNGSTMKHVFELKGPVAGSVGRSSARTSRDLDENVSSTGSPSKPNIDWKEPSNGLLGSPLSSQSPPHLRALEDPFSPEAGQPLIVAEDFLPFTTPRRLVRSLQESFSSSQMESTPTRFVDQDVTKLRGEDEVRESIATTDMDLGTPTSTSTGWSVRTNPIASDDSQRTESDDSDQEQGRPVWKKMVLDSSPSPNPPAPHTPPVQEPYNSDIAEHRVSYSLSAAAPSVVLQDEPSQALFEPSNSEDRSSRSSPQALFEPMNLEILSARSSCGESIVQLKPESEEVDYHQRTHQSPSSPITSTGGGEMDFSESAHDNYVDKWSCIETRSPGTEQDSVVVPDVAVAAQIEERSETVTAAATAAVLPVGDEIARKNLGDNMRDFFSRGWNLGQISWSVCVVVVAIPLVLVLTKVAFPSDSFYTEYLVPT